MASASAAERGLAARLAPWKWWIMALAVLAGVWALDVWNNARPLPEAIDWQPSPFSGSGPPLSYAEAIRRSDIAIANARAAAEAGGDQWLMHEIHASELMARAQLTGDYRDYAAAEAALDQAFAVAVRGSGPHLMRAALDFSMHRLAAAEAQLAATDGYAVPPDPGDRAEIAAMRGDIAFYRGDYDKAWALYDTADRLVPGSAHFRRAIFAARTGKVDLADAYLAEAEKGYRSPTPQTRSYMQLQRGILDLDRGRLDDAMVHFREADRLFPGRWLIEEHIAEVLTLQGRTGQAEKLYRDIVKRTGHPEFIDALAAIVEARGDKAEARRLYARSSKIWAERLKLFPEATYGHAIDHCMARRDWACALRLAEANHQARPYGEAKIKLAAALLANRRIDEARALIDTVLASRWRTHDLFTTAAQIYAASGLSRQAERYRSIARSMNPIA
ncbi:hypothetical protein C7451_111115 [Blastomonas natatoria]|uniref:Tetratricopeptide repeat protein n=1 Tax=Blastomonas natatoria TaxID=34015 RepID=A0A2V3UUE0_9SPHN|nr:hypothetical protein [Blastomonas natatoria]PXW72993.1 hypothetical protein C7451_111115 [Blastomonas natatoria]